MAPLPPLTPPPPGTPGSRVRVRTRSTIPEEIVEGSGSAEIILAKLRGMVARGGQDTDAILGTISVAAHALTGANGAAIAMPRDGAVVCVGRSGEMAPELGDLLNVNSGISGECLRTGRIMRCDDASRDFHVDPDVCRQLNLQSIAAVPLRGRQGRVGVLETFSDRSYAFTEEHMELLGRLAGLAESAWAQAPEAQELGTLLLGEEPAAQELVADQPVAEESLQTQPLHSYSPPTETRVQRKALPEKLRLAGTLTRVRAAIAARFHLDLRDERRWRYGTIVGMTAVLLVLLAVLSLKVWYKASLSTRSVGSPQSAVSNSPDTAGGVGLAWDPGSEHAVSTSISSAPAASTSAGASSPLTSSPPNSSLNTTKSPAAVEGTARMVRGKLVVPAATDRGHIETASADVPQVPTSDDAPSDLGRLLPASPALPRLTVPISQGVSGGTLVHRVVPVYPLEARQLHVQGTVVLEATINENGQIENLKVVSGSPLLAQSATDAVRKWRYSPYLLNGKPIKKETQITITFIPE